jgi:hypothetical protein
MTITVNHTTAVRRIGVLAFMGVATVLVGLGGSGNAAAAPPPFEPPLPGYQDNPRGPSTVDPVVGDWVIPPSPPVPWNAAPPPGPDLGDSVRLNPQPLPPGPDRGIRVSLNPQPLPPGPDRGFRVGLNPQPLPPGPDLWLDSLILPGF